VVILLRGNSRNSFQRKFAQGSDLFANSGIAVKRSHVVSNSGQAVLLAIREAHGRQHETDFVWRALAAGAAAALKWTRAAASEPMPETFHIRLDFDPSVFESKGFSSASQKGPARGSKFNSVRRDSIAFHDLGGRL
jgi:hypothetical protein